MFGEIQRAEEERFALLLEEQRLAEQLRTEKEAEETALQRAVEDNVADVVLSAARVVEEQERERQQKLDAQRSKLLKFVRNEIVLGKIVEETIAAGHERVLQKAAERLLEEEEEEKKTVKQYVSALVKGAFGEGEAEGRARVIVPELVAEVVGAVVEEAMSREAREHAESAEVEREKQTKKEKEERERKVAEDKKEAERLEKEEEQRALISRIELTTKPWVRELLGPIAVNVEASQNEEVREQLLAKKVGEFFHSRAHNFVISWAFRWLGIGRR